MNSVNCQTLNRCCKTTICPLGKPKSCELYTSVIITSIHTGHGKQRLVTVRSLCEVISVGVPHAATAVVKALVLHFAKDDVTGELIAAEAELADSVFDHVGERRDHVLAFRRFVRLVPEIGLQHADDDAFYFRRVEFVLCVGTESVRVLVSCQGDGGVVGARAVRQHAAGHASSPVHGHAARRHGDGAHLRHLGHAAGMRRRHLGHASVVTPGPRAAVQRLHAHDAQLLSLTLFPVFLLRRYA